MSSDTSQASDTAGTKECPYCAETIKAKAVKCRFCGSDLVTPGPASPPPPAEAGAAADAFPVAPAAAAATAPPASPRLEPGHLVDLLTHLVDKNLVVYEEDEPGQGRYRLLDTVRQYSRDRLLERSEGEPVRDRHLDCFLALAERAEPELHGSDQAQWLNRLETEHDNLRVALEWSRSRGSAAPAGLRLAGALGLFWRLHGHVTEGRERLAAALTNDHRPTRERAKALNAAGRLAHSQGDLPAERARSEEALSIARALADHGNLIAALYGLAETARDQGDYTSARALYEEILTRTRQAGDKRGVADSLRGLGLVAFALGDDAAARARLQECLVIRRELKDKAVFIERYHLAMIFLGQGDTAQARTLLEANVAAGKELGVRTGAVWALGGLADVALAEGDYGAVRIYLEQSLAAFREMSADWLGLAHSLDRFAALAKVYGESQRAARLYGAADAWRESLGFPLTPVRRIHCDQDTVFLRTLLGEEAFAAAWAEGQALSLEQAVAYALEADNA